MIYPQSNKTHNALTSWLIAATYLKDEMNSGRVRHLSVDVFDTLLIRTTSPESVIAATSRHVSGRLGLPFSEVMDARGKAWGLESASSKELGRCPDAMSASLFRRWIGLLGCDSQSINEIAAEALRFEIQSERKCLIPNPEMFEVLKVARNCGIGVTALSDMYLSPEEVGELLSAHGFSGLIDDIETSGYLGKQKKTGKLFDWYVEKMGGPSGLIHVGDDYLADGRMPSARGIRSVSVYDRSRMRVRHRLSVSRSEPATEAALSTLHSLSATSLAKDIGFTRFGPIYTGFVHAVAARAVADGVNSVWFLAREGWLLHELYSLAKNHEAVEAAPPSGYLYASRVATMRAQLLEFGDSEIGSIHSDTWSRTYRSTLSPLQLDDAVLPGILAGIGLTPDTEVSESSLASLRKHRPFVDAVAAVGKTEREGLKRYLEMTGFPPSGKVAVVDVGWGGQIQENFQKSLRLLGYQTELVGYYLGTDERAESRRKTAGMVMHGLIIDKLNNDGCGLGAFSHVQGIELATRSPHGSVKGYAADGMPRLAAETDKGRMVEATDDAFIATMQTGILAYASAYFRTASVIDVRAADSVKLARNVLDVAALMPSRREANVVTDMKNVANLGGDETIRLGGGISLFRPRKAIRVLRTTLWQEGTCAALLPEVGPLILLAARKWKKCLPGRQGVLCPTVENEDSINVSSSVSIVADVRGLDLTRKRLELVDTYRGPSTAETLSINSLGDAVRLLFIRLAHGAPVKPVFRSVKSEIKATFRYLRDHPRIKKVKYLL
jgi:hypothetical protein